MYTWTVKRNACSICACAVCGYSHYNSEVCTFIRINECVHRLACYICCSHIQHTYIHTRMQQYEVLTGRERVCVVIPDTNIRTSSESIHDHL